MFLHYLKIAFRNMRKYKNQTLISIISLAVGFTCFALATLWIRHEMTFDSFHKKAGQLYVVYTPSGFSQSGYSRIATPHQMAPYLKNTFSEIANATLLIPARNEEKLTVEGVEFPALFIQADSSFFTMFDMKILEGSRELMFSDFRNLAITSEKARQLFGDESPIGKTVYRWGDEFTISAVVSGMSKQSNYPFDFIQWFPVFFLDAISGYMHVNTIIELIPGTNIETFEKKLYEHEAIFIEYLIINKIKIKPLTKLRYTDPDIVRGVKFQHILIFSVSGLLVVLCSLFNYLTLFVSRFRIRQKELALRVVCGASGGSLLMMLSVEFILTLLFSVLLGCTLTQLALIPFLTLSEIQMGLPSIYRESLMYIGGVILVSLLVFWLILIIFRMSNLNVSIRRSNKYLSRKISVIVQLVVSIVFAFSAIIILKQIHFLHHTAELGFSFKNRGSLIAWGENSEVFANHLKQIPEITEVVHARGMTSLLPNSGRWSRDIASWDNRPADVENITLEHLWVSPEYMSFYEFRLIAGETLTDADPESMVLLNESAVKAFGWHDPIGKRFENHFTVKGVIKHVYNFAPTVAAKPVVFLKPSPEMETMNRHSLEEGIVYARPVLFKYQQSTWKSCIEKIEKMKNDFDISGITNAEEMYNNYLKSEKALITLLSFVSVICVLICLFGFISLVSLTCEERRKEIAIRKINGATTDDILAIFAKEYFLLLIIGSVIAFTTGYFIMQRWLEQYVKQTNIPAWIFLAIVLVLALVIVLCVGWQVYRASIENPAEIVKSE